MNYINNFTLTSAPGGFDFMSMLPLVMIFGVFYFMLIRPQQKKMKQHQELLGNLKKGDRVITTGGLIGTVENTNGEREITLEIADGIKVQVIRAMISEVMNKISGTENAPSKKFEAIKGGAKKASTTKKK